MSKLKKNRLWLLLLIALFAGISFIHLWRITTLPDGYYVDETSIGLNAALIAKTGQDEHSQTMPIFFKAFGEYKNPLYIYTAALVFKIFGVSEFNLRFTSFIFYFLFLIGLYLTSQAIFKNRFITFLAIFIAGFLPWFFSISRIAFEVISQLTVFIFALFFAYKTYETKIPKNSLYPILAGFFSGLTLYTYTTSRFFAFAWIGLIFLIYFRKTFWRKHLLVASGFILAAIPYFYFLLKNPGALTYRFRIITFFYNHTMTLSQKIFLFLKYYLTYFNLKFLLFNGDPNSRHHPGGVGMVYFTVFVLAIIGLTVAIYLILKKKNRFWLLILLSLILGPSAAALTIGYESLRSVLMAVYILLFALLGFWGILKYLPRKFIKPVIIIIFLALSVESFFYLKKYFIAYPKVTAYAFEGSGFKESLVMASKIYPGNIYVSAKGNDYSANVGFYHQILAQKSATFVLKKTFQAERNSCIILNSWDRKVDNQDKLPAKYFSDFNKFWQAVCY